MKKDKIIIIIIDYKFKLGSKFYKLYLKVNVSNRFLHYLTAKSSWDDWIRYNHLYLLKNKRIPSLTRWPFLCNFSFRFCLHVPFICFSCLFESWVRRTKCTGYIFLYYKLYNRWIHNVHEFLLSLLLWILHSLRYEKCFI